jgi:hypothetical protein
MRSDEITQLKEQRKHVLAEMRSMASRYEDGRAWAPEDSERYDYCYKQASGINEKLEQNHQQELEEIRSARGGTVSEFKTAGFERSHAPEPLYQAFRSAGFARGEPAEIPWQEFRSITWTGSVDNLNQPRRNAEYLGYDQRYAYQALPSVGVDAGVTSISLLTQTARTLATPANVIRAIDAVTAKPETTETMTVATVALKQLASVVSDVPNIFIENQQAGSIIENDLKLAITDALDDLLKQSTAWPWPDPSSRPSFPTVPQTCGNPCSPSPTSPAGSGRSKPGPPLGFSRVDLRPTTRRSACSSWLTACTPSTETTVSRPRSCASFFSKTKRGRGRPGTTARPSHRARSRACCTGSRFALAPSVWRMERPPRATCASRSRTRGSTTFPPIPRIYPPKRHNPHQ